MKNPELKQRNGAAVDKALIGVEKISLARAAISPKTPRIGRVSAEDAAVDGKFYICRA